MKPQLIIILTLLTCSTLFAQVERSSDLYKTIKAQDSLLFDIGFNTCDIRQFEDLLSENFEFYHDEAGITSTKAAFITSIRDGLCKMNYKARRELLPNSFEVYPLEKNGALYGAIEKGEHNFYAIEKQKPEYLTSTAKFTQVWLLENGSWKLSRVLSYDHKNPEKEDPLLLKDKTVTEKWLLEKRIPTLGIGYIKDGKIREVTVYGKNEKGIPYPKNTIWNVASLTKPVTAMIALQLVNSGKWDLDVPVYNYWTDPDLANDPRNVMLTMRHILSHQTGFPNWRRESADGKLAFEFTPGTKYQYSGEGYEYLRHVLERKFNKTLDELARELIFEPLKMKDTHFFWDSTVDESRFATWHKGDGSLYPTEKNTTANGADDLLTTVADYCKFMVYVMNGAGLSDDLYLNMISKQVQIKPRKYFGLGWWVDENVRSGENALVHGGDDIGVHTIVFLLPKSKEGLVIFTNCDNGTDIYIPVIQHYLGKAGQEIIDIETK